MAHLCQIHAYVLMTNHVHLLVTPAAGDSIPLLMQALGRRYVRYVNMTCGRTGTLWEGRYKACLVEGERYFLACHWIPQADALDIVRFFIQALAAMSPMTFIG